MAVRIVSFLFLGLTVAACSSLESTPSDRAQASLVPSATNPNAPATATAELSQIVAPTADDVAVLAPDDVAEVVTTDLVMRSAPGVGQDSQIFDRLLSGPQLLYVLDGPVAADGYDWYLAAPFRVEVAPYNPTDDLIGWVAAGSREGEPWIAPTELRCPEPTLEAVSGQSPMANLGCYGGQQLTLEGVFNGCFVADPVTIVPAWLSSSGCSILVLGSEPTALPAAGGGLVIRPAATSGAPDEPGAPVLVRGHFDDPEARTCQRLAIGVLPVGVANTILWCRTQFVATGF